MESIFLKEPFCLNLINIKRGTFIRSIQQWFKPIFLKDNINNRLPTELTWNLRNIYIYVNWNSCDNYNPNCTSQIIKLLYIIVIEIFFIVLLYFLLSKSHSLRKEYSFNIFIYLHDMTLLYFFVFVFFCK